LPLLTDAPDLFILNVRHADHLLSADYINYGKISIQIKNKLRHEMRHSTNEGKTREFLLSSQLGCIARRVPKYLTLCERLMPSVGIVRPSQNASFGVPDKVNSSRVQHML
jgi:hypothetical protein